MYCNTVAYSLDHGCHGNSVTVFPFYFIALNHIMNALLWKLGNAFYLVLLPS